MLESFVKRQSKGKLLVEIKMHENYNTPLINTISPLYDKYQVAKRLKGAAIAFDIHKDCMNQFSFQYI